jgi:hypothetical protein
MKGDEKKAIEILGGKNHIEKRKKRVRKERLSIVRISAVLILVLSIIFIGFIPESVVTMEEDTKNYEIPGYVSKDKLIDFPAYHYRGPLLGWREEEPEPGDEFIVSFSVNSTIFEASIVFGNKNGEIVGEVLRNVSSGEFHFTIKEDYRYYLYIKVHSDSEWENHTYIFAAIRVTVKHINTFNPDNHLVAFAILAIFIPLEFLIWYRRQILN